MAADAAGSGAEVPAARRVDQARAVCGDAHAGIGGRRAPRQARAQNRRALHVQLTSQGYDGGYTRLTDFIRRWRDKQGKLISARAFVPLAFELGEAFQFDWSEEGMVVGGIYYRMQVSHLKLCASRAFWLVAYPSQGHEMLFDAHTRSFAAMGGIARRGIIDFVPGNKSMRISCGVPPKCSKASMWQRSTVPRSWCSTYRPHR